MILSNDPRAVLAKKRTIAVRTEAIFAAFSDPAQLACWWGPEGFTNSFETFGFEPEGLYMFVIYRPNGIEHPNE